MFHNFETLAQGDRFFLRVGGSRLDPVVLPDLSGWLCVDRQTRTCFVTWAASPPVSCPLWTVLDLNVPTRQPDGVYMTVYGETADLGTFALDFVPNATENQLVRIVEGPNPSCVFFSSGFSGYSDNSVPSYGFEEHAFVIRDQFGQTLGLTAQDSQPELCYKLGLDSSGFNCLYYDGPRDSLSQGNVAVRVFVQTPPARSAKNKRLYLGLGENLATSSSSLVRPAYLTELPEQAVVCQLRGVVQTDQESSFAVGVVGSVWALSSDNSLNLVWGQPSASQAVSTVFAKTDSSPLELDSPTTWTIQRGSSQYVVVVQSLTSMVLRQLSPTTGPSSLVFGFEPVPSKRLLLNWNPSSAPELQGSVSVLRPTLVLNQAKVTGGSPNFGLPTPGPSLLGSLASPGCEIARAQGDEPNDLGFPNWFPVLQPFDPSTPVTERALVSWVSGNAPGNTYWLSAQNGPQNVRRTLIVLPMALSAVCLIDYATGQVPLNCGAVRLNPLDSNIGAFPMFAAQKHIPDQPSFSNCQLLFGQNLTQNSDEGFAWIFENPNCSTSGNQPSSNWLKIASTQTIGPITMAVRAVIVPENLFLTVRQTTGVNRAVLFLRPGTYTGSSLLVVDSRWPAPGTVVTFTATCSTVSPRSFYIANSCMGSAATESQVWVRDKPDCNNFFDAQCVSGPLANSAQCGCFQDIAWLQSLGLGDTGAKMINAPQCWGRVCPLGSGYRKAGWTQGCGMICSQLIAGSGRDFYQSGIQTMSCGGDVYPIPAATQTPAPVPANTTGWVVAIVAAGVTALVFLILFVVFYVKRKPQQQQPQQLQS